MTWDDLDWLASLSSLPVMPKGILHPDDAVRAVEHGARAVIVSNHGGRQLDSAVAALDALPAVVEAVGGRAEVLVDGGVRRGTDVLKALALGARAVLIGRPIHWGLAVGGEAGVRHVLELLRAELALDLMLCGLASPDEVDRSLLVPWTVVRHPSRHWHSSQQRGFPMRTELTRDCHRRWRSGGAGPQLLPDRAGPLAPRARAGRIVESWRSKRWDSLRLIAPNWSLRATGIRRTPATTPTASWAKTRSSPTSRPMRGRLPHLSAKECG